jgi:hypothetical protein
MIKTEIKIKKILDTYNNGNLSKDKATRLILIETGDKKSEYCSLDRFTTECNVFKTTSGGCNDCGLNIR